jgi:hypothetical protein
MDIAFNKQLGLSKAGFLLLAILFCTYVRISLLIVYPLVVIAVLYICNWKLNRNILYVFAAVAVCWLFSFRNGIHLKYNIVSFYYYIPFLILVFASPHPNPNTSNYFRMFVNGLTIVAIVNNIPGIIQYFIQPNDDRFVGIYGSFTVSQNGLSILNAVLFFYYLSKYIIQKNAENFILIIFFLFCCIMGFYGAGQLALIAATMLTFLKVKTKNIIQLALVSILGLGMIVLLMHLISPSTLEYNITILKKFLDPTAPRAPRKLIVFRNYFNSYPSHILDFLFGSGPGTFNSRSAFMVGSPSYFNVEFIKSDAQPYYFKNYAYPLWNETNTGPYDGFMNQPFTSILSLLGEYGLIITTAVLLFAVKKFHYFNKVSSAIAKNANVEVESMMYKFCSIYLLLLIVIDNYIEYPEIIGLLLILIKMSQQQISKALK